MKSGARVPRAVRAKPTVLITGFGPFPGVPQNASARLARELATQARRRHPDFRFVAAVLPVSWDAAPHRLARLIERTNPVLALHFGVSKRAGGFVLETLARNRAVPRPDHEGRAPVSSALVPGGRRELSATLPAATLAKALRTLDLETRLSKNAGTYLCNAVLYRSLAQAAARKKHRGQPGHAALFVHIPVETGRTAKKRTSPDKGPAAARLSWADARAGAHALLAAALAAAAPRLKRP